MAKRPRICVYCGASNGVADHYKRAAYDLGRLLAEHCAEVVYGGGRDGLMGRLGDGVADGGGRLVGILPRHFDDREIAHPRLDELVIVESMHERKQSMADRSDGFIVLPGGYGTLDEMFEMVTWRQLGLHDKPILIVDVEAYWSPLKSLVEKIEGEGFAARSDRAPMHWVNDLSEIMPRLQPLL